VSSALVLAALVAALPAARAQSRVPQPPSMNVRTVLEQGQQLENQRRWGEALSLYEESLRELPGEADLETRFRTAKIHYDLGRRYHDQSFRRSLTELKELDALGVYSDVLLKIQSHYVDEPNWKGLVEHGTATLSTALVDEVFVAQHLKDVSPEQVAAFRRDLDARLRTFPVRSRHEARDAVAWASRFGRDRLGLSSTAVVLEYVCGASNLLDDYSSYLTKDQLTEVYAQIEGNFVGLGIELKSTEGALQILRVIPGSPADRGGLRPQDQIVAVDGKSTAAFNTDQAANLLQGKEGSLVEVSVVSPGQQPRQLRLRREHVEVPSVDDVKIVDQLAGIGYLRLNCFQKTTSRDLDAALWKLHRLGMKSLIMDLRGNPGGLLSSSVEVVDKFVTTGTIVSTRGRSPQEDYTYTARSAGTWRVPLVVLIDGDSASASEIFAGAIRDHQRGTIVGEKSYGKGSVQGIFPLTAGSGIRLTTAKFYSPHGKPFSKVGVEPHQTVHQTAKPVITPAGEASAAESPDAILEAGVEAARNQLPRRVAHGGN
jgi:carboxyl-terminal processing protease